MSIGNRLNTHPYRSWIYSRCYDSDQNFAKLHWICGVTSLDEDTKILDLKWLRRISDLKKVAQELTSWTLFFFFFLFFFHAMVPFDPYNGWRGKRTYLPLYWLWPKFFFFFFLSVQCVGECKYLNKIYVEWQMQLNNREQVRIVIKKVLVGEFK